MTGGHVAIGLYLTGFVWYWYETDTITEAFLWPFFVIVDIVYDIFEDTDGWP